MSCQGGLNQVLGGAAQRGVKMLIVGIDGRGAPLKIWKNGDGAVLQPKLPAWGVMAGGRQRRITNQLALHRGAATGRLGRMTPSLTGQHLEPEVPFAVKHPPKTDDSHAATAPESMNCILLIM